MSEIALVQPDYQNIVPDTTSIPLGIAWLSSYLKKNDYDVDCFDLSIGDDHIDWSNYKIIGIQIHSEESLSYVLELIQRFKKKSNSIIIAGGPVATLAWSKVIEVNEVDFVILNEGEIPLAKLASYILRKEGCLEKIDGIVYRNKEGVIINNTKLSSISDLDTIPIPDRNAFRWDKYKQWSIITSRGCPYRCRFCSSPNFWNNSFRQRSPENVYGEICHIEKLYGVKKFFILDDTFTINEKNTNKLLDLIIAGEHHFEWACLTRADLLNEGLLIKMKKAGCTTISLGVESANQDTLDYLHKDIKLESYEKVIPLIKNVGIRVRCSFIFGLPNENIQHLNNNIEFILSTQPDEIQIYPLFPYDGTELSKCHDFTQHAKMEKKDALNPVIETLTLKSSDIKNSVMQCIDELKSIGYTWLSSYEIVPQKGNYDKVVMTEFAPIQKLE